MKLRRINHWMKINCLMNSNETLQITLLTKKRKTDELKLTIGQRKRRIRSEKMSRRGGRTSQRRRSSNSSDSFSSFPPTSLRLHRCVGNSSGSHCTTGGWNRWSFFLTRSIVEFTVGLKKKKSDRASLCLYCSLLISTLHSFVEQGKGSHSSFSWTNEKKMFIDDKVRLAFQ